MQHHHHSKADGVLALQDLAEPGVPIGRIPEYGRHTAEDWNMHRKRIEALYVTENKPLREVMQIMREERGFIATAKVYKDRFKQWGISKNVKRKVKNTRCPRASRSLAGQSQGHPQPCKALRTAQHVYTQEACLVLIGDYIQSSREAAEYRPERNRDWWELLTLGMGLVEAKMCEQGFRLLNLCLDHYALRIEHPGPELVLDTYIALAYLSGTRFPDIASLFAQHISQLAFILLPASHPLRRAWAAPVNHSHLGEKDFTRVLADVVLDACHSRITNRHSFSTFSNTLLCLDHLRSTDIISNDHYHLRYRENLKGLHFRGDPREHQFMHSLLAVKEALGRGDWKKADRYLETAESILDESDTIPTWFRTLLPDSKAYGRELAIQIGLLQDFNNDSNSPCSSSPTTTSMSNNADPEMWNSRPRPTEQLARKTTDIFEIHYTEILKRTAELKRRQYSTYEPQSQPDSDLASHPLAESSLGRTAEDEIISSDNPSAEVANTDIKLPSTLSKAMNSHVDNVQRLINKKALMCWLWQWLFVGCLRISSGDEPQTNGKTGPSSSMTMDKWIAAHFFGLDWQSPRISAVSMQYFSITVTHHINGGGAWQSFTYAKA